MKLRRRHCYWWSTMGQGKLLDWPWTKFDRRGLNCLSGFALKNWVLSCCLTYGAKINAVSSNHFERMTGLAFSAIVSLLLYLFAVQGLSEKLMWYRQVVPRRSPTQVVILLFCLRMLSCYKFLKPGRSFWIMEQDCCLCLLSYKMKVWLLYR